MLRLRAFFGLLLFATLAVAQAHCDRLKLSFPDATISAIEFVPAGPFVSPSGNVGPGPAGRAQPAPVPAYCRILLTLTPSSDSHIEAGVFLPVEDWNGKLQVVGNGGWAGSIRYPLIAAALRDHYAPASNDTWQHPTDAAGPRVAAPA